MDEKAPLLRPLPKLVRPLVRRESGSIRWEVFLSIIAIVGFTVLSLTVHKSANPRQDVYFVGDDEGRPLDSLPFSWSNITPSRTLRWQPCFDEEHDCARLDVPTDWLDPSDDDRVILAVVRLRANKTDDYRGPIFFNPGGPGGSGIFALKDHGKLLQTIVGRNHDIVTFDPRGVGASVPRIECWDSARKRDIWAQQETPLIDSHPGVLYDLWGRALAFSMACERAHAASGFLEHIGTASHARDMLEILQQMGEDKLRYWGFSYGTLLGGTFAAMYPDKVGRIVSDGNVDYEEWYGLTYINAVRDAEKIMGAFYELCHKAGPERCAFYGPSPSDIEQRHTAILENLRVRPIIHMPSGDDNGGAEDSDLLPEIVTYSKIRQLAATALYRPNYYFPHLAEILAALERGDGGAYRAFVARHGRPPAADVCSAERIPPTVPVTDGGEGSDDAYPAVLCADGPILPQDPRDFERGYLAGVLALSPTTGAVVAADRAACAGRTVRPRFAFRGPFAAATGEPILFVANMADNITPLVSARNNSAGFEGSVVLVQNSYGHTSLAAPSTCTAKVIREYFQSGALPEDGARCEADLLPFGVAGAKRTVGLSVDDRELAEATWELSMKAGWALGRGERVF